MAAFLRVSCCLGHCAIGSRKRSPWKGGTLMRGVMTASTRPGLSVGSYVRVVRPTPLEVGVDCGRRRGRRRILLTRDEVALAP